MTTTPTIDQALAGGQTGDTAGNTAADRSQGRLFGGLVLAAFVLYGAGSELAETPTGLVLVALNSVAVTIVGVIGFRLVRNRHPRAGAGYLATRVAEALLLGGGIALAALTDVADVTDVANTGYLLGMSVLGIGSLPFWHVVGRDRRLPRRLAGWGMVGYAALATGAVLELTTGKEVALILAIPGGLFELAVGLFLLRRGFGPPTDNTLPA